MPLGGIIRLLLEIPICGDLVEDNKITVISGSSVLRMTAWTNAHSGSLGINVYLYIFQNISLVTLYIKANMIYKWEISIYLYMFIRLLYIVSYT